MKPVFATFDEAEHRERLARARQAMREAGLRCLVCCGPENGYYIGGYDSWTAMNSPQALVFTDGDDEPTLLVRNVDLPLATESTWIADLRTYHLNRDNPAGLVAEILAEKSVTGGRVGLDLQTAAVTGAWLRLLEQALSPLPIVDATLLLGDLRLYKSAEEIGRLRQAALYARCGLAAARAAFRSGRTEIAVAGDVEAAMRAAGSDYPAIATEFTSGSRSAGCHGTPRARVIQRGDIGHLEFAGVCDRYHVTAMTTLACGGPSVRAREIYRLCAQSLRAGMDVIAPGIPAAAVEEASLEPLRQAGLEHAALMRFGYGIGIAYPPIWLETLQIDRQSVQRLEADMVFVLHACIELPEESLGVILGGTWLLTANGLEMLAGDGDVPLEVLD